MLRRAILIATIASWLAFIPAASIAGGDHLLFVLLLVAPLSLMALLWDQNTQALGLLATGLAFIAITALAGSQITLWAAAALPVLCLVSFGVLEIFRIHHPKRARLQP